MRDRTMRVFIIFLIAALFTALAYWYLSDRIWRQVSYQAAPAIPQKTEKPVSSDQYAKVDTNEHTKNVINDTNVLQGSVIQIIEPANSERGLKWATISADIIDVEKTKSMTFSEGSVQLPMVRKELKVIFDKQTKFSKGDLKSLNAGDFVSVELSDSIYGGKELTAVKAEIVNWPNQ